MTEAHETIPLIGRAAELRSLRAAIEKRESLLVWGPADSGKTALVRGLIGLLPRELRQRCLYSGDARTIQELLRDLHRQLFERENLLVREKFSADGATGAGIDRWVKTQTSLRLRGLFYRAATLANYWIFLDHMPPASHALARLMKEIIWRAKTPVYFVARGCTRKEIGYAWSLYWVDQYRLGLGPLAEPAAGELFDTCVRHFGLASLDTRDFREQVLDWSGMLPGTIVKMCALAARPRYHFGRRIKGVLVHVDYLASRQSEALHHTQDREVLSRSRDNAAGKTEPDFIH